jgi:hypothetical protein
MDGDGTIHIHLSSSDSTLEPRQGAGVLRLDHQQLVESVDHIIQRLRLNEVILLPVAKWRNIFDAVAFSLATNEDWQKFDAAATVELNTRDPLLCVPSDFHTLSAMIQALMSNADTPDQGLILAAPAVPLLVELASENDIRISVGNQVLADEINESLGFEVG